MKKILMIVVPILILGGSFLGLAMAGVVQVPGLSPRKTKPPGLYGEKKDSKPAEKAEAPAPPKKEKLKVEPPKVKAEVKDESKGLKKLAQLWNNLPSAKLAEVAKEYSDKDLAPVLVAMDPEKVAEFLSLVDSKRSAKLSKELQRVASIVPKEPS